MESCAVKVDDIIVSCAVCAARRDSGGLDVSMDSPMLQLLLKWCRTVCLHYGVKVTMDTTLVLPTTKSKQGINLFCAMVL